jgi:hypothetical protein
VPGPGLNDSNPPDRSDAALPGQDERGAGATLIAAYLDALGRELAASSPLRQFDVERILDEVASHLEESVARLKHEGYSSREAAQRAIERFGQPELLAARFRADAADGSIRAVLPATAEGEGTMMMVIRALGATFALAGLYYLNFYLARHEPTTLVQMSTLFCAAVSLLLQRSPANAANPWFTAPAGRWQPVGWQGWLTLAGAAATAVVVGVALDRDSHSVSDTVIRVLPTWSLIAAVTVKLICERTGSTARPDRSAAR